MIVTYVLASLLLGGLAPGQDGGVQPDPYQGDKIMLWDEDTSAPKVPPPPAWSQVPVDAPETYEPEPFFCRPEAPFPNDECITPLEPVETEDPEVTTIDVEREVKRIGLPSLRVSVQPAGSTLVNLETIFHTTAAPF